MQRPFRKKTYKGALKKIAEYQWEFVGTEDEVRAGVGKMAQVCEKHFPGLDWSALDPQLRNTAAYVHVQMFKSLGPTEIRSPAWNRVVPLYLSTLFTGACMAYHVLGKERFQYGIGEPAVLERTYKIIQGPGNDERCDFVEAVIGRDLGGSSFLELAPRLMAREFGRPVPPNVAQIMFVLYARLLWHGYLGAFVASENCMSKSGASPSGCAIGIGLVIGALAGTWMILA